MSNNLEFLIRKGSAYRKVFNSPEGRKILLDILNYSGYYKAKSVRDSNELFENNGMRKVAAYILGLSTMKKEDLIQIQKVFEESKNNLF